MRILFSRNVCEMVLHVLFLIPTVFEYEIKQRLQRRQNAEWRLVNSQVNAALKFIEDSGDQFAGPQLVSPVKKKGSVGVKLTRARRIRDDDPQVFTEEFTRSAGSLTLPSIVDSGIVLCVTCDMFSC